MTRRRHPEPPARSLPPDVEEQVARADKARRARERATWALKREGLGAGLSLVDIAAVHDGLAAEYRRQHEDAKRAGMAKP